MNREFFTPTEIISVGSVDLPNSINGLNRFISKNRWRHMQGLALKQAVVGGGWTYHISLLPADAQLRLQLAFGSPANANESASAQDRDGLWAHYESLSKRQKGVCETRLEMLIEVAAYQNALDCTDTVALQAIASRHGIGVRTLGRYRASIKGAERADWLAALAPDVYKTRSRAEVSEEVWACLMTDYLRPEAPHFTACYRRLARAAVEHEWGPIPAERSLRRRMNAEVEQPIQILARDGREKALQIYPAQRRTVKGLHAMEAVNMDGHKFDVFVRWYDGRIVRPIGIALQDLYSRKFVAMRLSDSENKETTRLAIGEMVSSHGIPDKLTTDNGTAFSSKWITGGAPSRFRFKVKDEEPMGLLTQLGVETHFAIPGRGQSKPIERGFRDLTETISKHPAFHGAYVGNKPAAKPENYNTRAILIEEFEAIMRQELAAHNAQQGRRTEMANGRSFDEVFQESIEAPTTIIRWPSQGQRALWMLAAEAIRTKKGSGEIHMFNGLNRYWSIELNAVANQKVIVRFDPEHLHEGIKVYDLNERFICDAPIISNVGYYSQTDARDQERKRTALLRNYKEEQRLIASMKVETLAQLYQSKAAKDATTPIPPKVQGLAIAGQKSSRPRTVEHEELDERETEEAFARGLKMISGGRQ